MQTKAAVIGLAGLFVVAAGVMAMGKKPEVAPQEPDVEVERTQSGEPALPPSPMNPAVDVPSTCPSAVNGIILTFEDKHTDATRAAIKAYDEANRDPNFIEPDAERAIQFVDLDMDGDQDFMALYTGINWCGSAGCQVEAFVNDGNNSYSGGKAFYTAKGDAVMLEAVMNGFRQAITPVQDGGLPSERHLWRWDGNAYVSGVHCLQND